MKLPPFPVCTLVILGLTTACAASSQSISPVTVRPAEEPASTLRPLDTSLMEEIGKSRKLEEPETAKPSEKKQGENPPDLRRKRLQLRRNRYLLLQDS